MTVSRSLVVIPAFNEELSIEWVVSSVRELGYTAVVIDDCSTDRTAAKAYGAGAVVIRLPINLGVGGALQTGFRYAIEHGYHSVIQVDADGQHPVDQITELELKARQTGAELIVGSRFTNDNSTFNTTAPRRLMMRLLARIASRVSGVRLTDTTSGFRFIGGRLLKRFAKEFPDYYLGDTVEAVLIAARCGFEVSEIPARISPRMYGNSSVSPTSASMLIAKVLLLTLLRSYQCDQVPASSATRELGR